MCVLTYDRLLGSRRRPKLDVLEFGESRRGNTSSHRIYQAKSEQLLELARVLRCREETS